MHWDNTARRASSGLDQCGYKQQRRDGRRHDLRHQKAKANPPYGEKAANILEKRGMAAVARAIDNGVG
jgi:hypothetical protein